MYDKAEVERFKRAAVAVIYALRAACKDIDIDPRIMAEIDKRIEGLSTGREGKVV